MPYVASYSNVTRAVVADGVWEEAWAFLSSWRGFLQSVPGFMGASIGARRLDDDRIRLQTVTTWEHLEQLEEWMESEWTAAKALARLTRPAERIEDEIIEDYT